MSGVDDLLAEARSRLDRLSPDEPAGKMDRGALLIDIRPSEQHERDGEISGAHVVQRNVLEWRLDPDSPNRVPQLARGWIDAGLPIRRR